MTIMFGRVARDEAIAEMGIPWGYDEWGGPNDQSSESKKGLRAVGSTGMNSGPPIGPRGVWEERGRCWKRGWKEKGGERLPRGLEEMEMEKKEGGGDLEEKILW